MRLETLPAEDVSASGDAHSVLAVPRRLTAVDVVANGAVTIAVTSRIFDVGLADALGEEVLAVEVRWWHCVWT